MAKPYEDYLEDFLESDDAFPVSKKFVLEEICPRVSKALSDFGDGWMEEIHSREIAALLCFVEGRCKP